MGQRDAAGAGVCFVVPTYNEAPNIVPLLRRLTGLHGEPDAAFLVVDDESPDGTGRLVREFAASDGRVHLLEGPRQGLGRAYVRGMVHAVETLGAGAVVQMDADFSHDPADARRLLARLADGADVAIGSRYVAGGTLDPRWHLGRRRLSRWGNLSARWIADIRGVRDCTSGFKAIGAEALRGPRRSRTSGRGATPSRWCSCTACSTPARASSRSRSISGSASTDGRSSASGASWSSSTASGGCA